MTSFPAIGPRLPRHQCMSDIHTYTEPVSSTPIPKLPPAPSQLHGLPAGVLIRDTCLKGSSGHLPSPLRPHTPGPRCNARPRRRARAPHCTVPFRVSNSMRSHAIGAHGVPRSPEGAGGVSWRRVGHSSSAETGQFACRHSLPERQRAVKCRRMVDDGCWTADGGRWTVDCRLQAADGGGLDGRR